MLTLPGLKPICGGHNAHLVFLITLNIIIVLLHPRYGLSGLPPLQHFNALFSPIGAKMTFQSM
jgi:hypothetical protein